MASVLPPINEIAPECECGCGAAVNWRPGKGWASFRKGHAGRGKPGSRLGAANSPEMRAKQSASLRDSWSGRRRRDADPTGLGVYATFEYREARDRLVGGKVCCRCGSDVRVHAHHEIPGDDSSLVPLCAACHVREHHGTSTSPAAPPVGSQAPLCACGCGEPTAWKRVRGWAKYKKGHANAIVPAGTRLAEPTLCACGCGEPTTFRFGKGWGVYKRGHRQRIEGGYRGLRIPAKKPPPKKR